MFRMIRKRLTSRAGETIAETLVGLLVSSLALVMLAGAISATWKLVYRSDTAMAAYYEANNALEAGSGGNTWSVRLTAEGGGAVRLVESADSLAVQGNINDTIGNKPVAAYRIKTGP